MSGLGGGAKEGGSSFSRGASTTSASSTSTPTPTPGGPAPAKEEKKPPGKSQDKGEGDGDEKAPEDALDEESSLKNIHKLLTEFIGEQQEEQEKEREKQGKKGRPSSPGSGGFGAISSSLNDGGQMQSLETPAPQSTPQTPSQQHQQQPLSSPRSAPNSVIADLARSFHEREYNLQELDQETRAKAVAPAPGSTTVKDFINHLHEQDMEMQPKLSPNPSGSGSGVEKKKEQEMSFSEALGIFADPQKQLGLTLSPTETRGDPNVIIKDRLRLANDKLQEGIRSFSDKLQEGIQNLSDGLQKGVQSLSGGKLNQEGGSSSQQRSNELQAVNNLFASCYQKASDTDFTKIEQSDAFKGSTESKALSKFQTVLASKEGQQAAMGLASANPELFVGMQVASIASEMSQKNDGGKPSPLRPPSPTRPKSPRGPS